MEPHASYRIRLYDGQEITARFIRSEQLPNEIQVRDKFVIGRTITIKIARFDYSVIEKTQPSSG